MIGPHVKYLSWSVKNRAVSITQPVCILSVDKWYVLSRTMCPLDSTYPLDIKGIVSSYWVMHIHVILVLNTNSQVQLKNNERATEILVIS